jgi:serine/threonine protein kinase
MFGSPEQLVGREIGGYRLERKLGTGAMGVVFQGRSAAHPQMAVALKLLIVPWNAAAADREQYQARFRREAQTLQRLRHPHIVPVLDFGEAEG